MKPRLRVARPQSEFQQLEVGDVQHLRRGEPGMRVEILEPKHVLSSRSEDGNWVWTFLLVEEEGATRLISRNRIAIPGASLAGRLGMLMMEPGSLVMERKMLLGIKERAERLAANPVEQTKPQPEPVGVAG